MASIQYNPAGVVCSFANIELNGGFAPDGGIAIEWVTPEFRTSVAGTWGDVAYSSKLDRRAKITFSMLRGTPQANLLRQMAIENLAAIQAGTPVAFAPFTLEDRSSGTRYIGPEACITALPSDEFKSEAGTVEYVIEVAALAIDA